ncbi:MAG: hypothetical protein K2W85_15565 [Phycisphaerales bacterium]|nr:hypothetical protein [Phycisphaerales bacterium]
MNMLLPAISGVLAMTPMPKPPYRPFIDPVQIDGYWWMFLPLMALLIALVYKAVKHANLKTYWWAVAKMTLEIVAGMVLLGVTSYLVVEVFARYIVEHAPR